MKDVIVGKLREIEQEFEVRVLFACESGSRAWGFASPDSDYDVRFIYVHPLDYYLSIYDYRDVIELPINDTLDIGGWELRKALKLFKRSNAPIYEWLQSPIIYMVDETFMTAMRRLMPKTFSTRAGIHHYISMARHVFEDELSGEMVRLKKYFYALRPILAAKWIADLKSVPPMDFASLRVLMPEPVNYLVDQLLEIKAQVDESYVTKSNADINTFIKECIDYCEDRVPSATGRDNDAELNMLFKRFVL